MILLHIDRAASNSRSYLKLTHLIIHHSLSLESKFCNKGILVCLVHSGISMHTHHSSDEQEGLMLKLNHVILEVKK